eukprot:COSAG01_NODE_1803_length_9197_cov_11.062321_4_plen_58_part_00
MVTFVLNGLLWWLLVWPLGMAAGAAAVASFLAADLTEIYLCNVCPCQEIISKRNGRG